MSERDARGPRGPDAAGARGRAPVPDAPAPLPFHHAVAVATLEEAGGLTFDLDLEAAERDALARFLGVAAVEGLRLSGTLSPAGEGYALDARLEAGVVQTCVVTLEPVAERVEARVERLWLPGVAPPDEAEVELGEDADRLPEPLGHEIDLAEPLVEAVVLGLEPFPRAPGAEHGTKVYGPPGAEPLTDEAARPFAGLADLRERLKRGGS